MAKKEETLPVVPTRNFISTEKKIKKTIQQDGILAIMGEPGLGKSFTKQIVIGSLLEKSGYRVIETQAWSPAVDITGSLINLMIDNLLAEKSRRDIIARVTQLKRGLIHYSQEKKIVLVIDEAQKLNPQTLYGLKQMHETGGGFGREFLFSIILFGQPSLQKLLYPKEINLRVNRHILKELSLAECKDFFAFFGTPIKEKAVARAVGEFGKTPAGIKRAAEILRSMSDSKEVTEDTVKKFIVGGRRDFVKRSGMSHNDIIAGVKEQYGIVYSKATISKTLTGEIDGKAPDTINAYLDSEIAKMSIAKNSRARQA